MVGFKSVKSLIQRSRGLRNLGDLFRWQIVEILIHRLTRIDLVLDTIEASHQYRREGEIRVARRVRATELDALGFRRRRVHRNTDRRGAVPLRVRQVHGRFVSGDQTLIRVRRRVRERQDRRSMLQKAADEVQRHLAQTGEAIPGEQAACRPSKG